MATYKFRIHRFTLIDNPENDVNTNNQYVTEDVVAATVDDAYAQMVSKYGDETQARIQYKGRTA